MQRLNQTLQALIRSSPLPITVLDIQGKVSLWNPAMERLIGWSEQDLSALAGLDPYGDALFTGEQLPALAIKLEAARRFLDEQYCQQRLAPELEPPARTGLETDADGEPCGRPGVLSFLATLRDFCRRAAEQKLAISALGD